MHSWSLSVLLTLTLIAAAYLRGWNRLRAAFPGVLQARRPAEFLAGLALLFAATGSPVTMLDHHYLAAHMAQHLVIMTVAVPLILLGAPVITLLHGLPRGLAVRLDSLRWRDPVITHPVFCWLFCTAVVIGWHVPSVFEMGMRSAPGHAIELSCFLVAGILFWWPVIRPWPSAAKWPAWSIPVYLFLATLPCDALSGFLCFCNRVVYPHYRSANALFYTRALEDQAFAGALMWVWVTFAYLVPAAALTFRMLSPGRRVLDEQAV